MTEVNFNIEKLDGGFLICSYNTTQNSQMIQVIVRNLSEVIDLLKATMERDEVA